jgi:two-component system KDP operon response regulator KdpE
MERSGRSAVSPSEPSSDSHCRVLVVDDESAIRKLLLSCLSATGYQMFEAATGQEAIRSVPLDRPDVILLDLGLPDLDGIEVTRTLREWTQTPILILSVRDQESDNVAALDAGADDYLTKPFGARELLARIRVALRRAARPAMGESFQVGDLSVDLARHLVELRGERVQLTPTEYDVLKILIRNTDRVLTHRQIIRELWGGLCHEDELHLLRVNVSNLRRKLEPDPARPRYVITEPGVGYTLRTETQH